MPITQQGALNTTALSVADVYVQIVPPQFLLNGVPTNVIGMVGTASWGPVNQPAIIGSPTQTTQVFGGVKNRRYDLNTAAVIAFQQGASAIVGVRVTDGTDAAATATVQTTCLTLTAKYTGSFGNNIVVYVGPGSAAASYQVRVAVPGQIAESFDNITGSGNALWIAIAAAINSGNATRGPSQFIVATAGAGTTAPSTASYTLASGADGATTITSTVLLGADTLPRTGMYALRGQGCSVGLLVDCADTTSWATQNAFGLAEGIYMVDCGSSGESISSAVTAKSSAGTDTFAMKIMLGDWIYWNDTVNGVPERLVPPSAFVAGELGNLSPERSTLNKQMRGIVATQKSKTGLPYTSADLQTLAGAGIDVVSNPVPGGKYFGCRNGRNASSNAVIHGDNYTRMTNYIATTLNQGMGIYIGELQSNDTRRHAKTTLDAFFANLQQQGMIADWKVVLDDSNNPQSRVALGYMQADVKVQYLSVIEFFIVNLEGGQSVTIQKAATQPIS